MAQVADSEWIEWKGGDMPVSADTKVKVRLAVETREEAEHTVARTAQFWEPAWQQARGGNRIAEYRVVSQ